MDRTADSRTSGAGGTFIKSLLFIGYSADTKGTEIPCFPMLEKLAQDLTIPLIAEGGIWEPQQLQKAFACGAYAAVIGTAITRPREITKRFVNAITK